MFAVHHASLPVCVGDVTEHKDDLYNHGCRHLLQPTYTHSLRLLSSCSLHVDLLVTVDMTLSGLVVTFFSFPFFLPTFRYPWGFYKYVIVDPSMLMLYARLSFSFK